MSNPFFSVCIPLHNREQTVRQTLESLARQTFRDFDVKIVDYGSTDSTRSEVAKFFQSQIYRNNAFDRELVFIDGQPRGVEDWNEPLKIADGKYIAVLEGDDAFLPTHLELVAEYLSTNDNVGIYSTGNQFRNRRKRGLFGSSEYSAYIYSMVEVPPPSEAVFIREGRNGERYFYNDRDFVYAPEIDLYLRILKDGFDAFCDGRQGVLRGTSAKREAAWKYHHDHFLILEMYRARPGITDDIYKKTRERQITRAVSSYIKDLRKRRVFYGEFRKAIIDQIGVREFHKHLVAGLFGALIRTVLSVVYQFDAYSRLRLAYEIWMNREKEPLLSPAIVLMYLLRDSSKLFPLKKYHNFANELSLVQDEHFQHVLKDHERFAYPKSWSRDLVVRNFNLILNEQSRERGNTSPHQYMDIERLPAELVIYDLGAGEGYQAKLWSRKAKLVVILEPDLDVYEALLVTFEREIEANRVKVLNVGASDGPGILRYRESSIRVDTLPNIIAQNSLPHPDYIKADIEGEELRFLMGAKELFDKDLVTYVDITVYHRPDDVTSVPKFFESYDGKGKFSSGVMIFNRDGLAKGSPKRAYHPVIRKCLYSFTFDQ